MVEYSNGDECMQMSCDECGTVNEFYGSWQDCIKEAKSNGWRIYKDGDDWVHICDECKETLR